MSKSGKPELLISAIQPEETYQSNNHLMMKCFLMKYKTLLNISEDYDNSKKLLWIRLCEWDDVRVGCVWEGAIFRQLFHKYEGN